MKKKKDWADKMAEKIESDSFVVRTEWWSEYMARKIRSIEKKGFNRAVKLLEENRPNANWRWLKDKK